VSERKPDAGRLLCASDTADVLERASELRRLTAHALVEAQRTTTGARFRFRASPDAERALREFVGWEARCCPFLTFRLDVQADEIRMDVEAPAGAGTLLDLLVAVTRPGA
jgi:hypothetical protein